MLFFVLFKLLMFIPSYDTDANGRKLYPVLLLKKDDWITYHAAKVSVTGHLHFICSILTFRFF